MGCIPLTDELKPLLPPLSTSSEIVIRGEQEDECLVVFDSKEKMFISDRLPEVVDTSTPLFRIRILDTEPPTLKLRKFWPGDEKEQNGENPTDEAIGFDRESLEKAMHRLSAASYNTPQELRLHEQAHTFTLQAGFDRLISLPMLNNLEPLDYQLKTVRRVLRDMRGRALLADEVGLGKTIEAGLIMMEYMLRRLVKKILILVPPSLIRQWKEEMRTKFNLDFVAHDSRQFKHAENGWAEFDRVIASLHTAKRKKRRQRIEEIEYDLVIVDEAHHLKNRSTLNWKLVNRIKKKFILLLTATPVQNRLEELFNLITLLRPGQLATASEFKRKHITRGDRLKPKNPEELKQLIRGVMVRNKRSQNEHLLTNRYARTINITLSREEKDFYDRMSTAIRRGHRIQKKTGGLNRLVLKTLQRELGSSVRAVLPTLQKIVSREELDPEIKKELKDLIGRARSLGEHTKLKRLIEIIAGIEDHVLIFTTFRGTQDFLVDRLEQAGISTAQFHGQMNRRKKEEEIDTFRNRKKVLISTESGGEGRNLQFCNRMINYDLPWNPMRIEQRIGRIHRIGQKRDIFIYNLSATETIESQILNLLDAKINMFELVVGELDMILGNVNDTRDFEDIIMDIWLESTDRGGFERNMEKLGEKLTAARLKYDQVKQYDEELFGDIFENE